jgi:hypothetical protein
MFLGAAQRLKPGCHGGNPQVVMVVIPSTLASSIIYNSWTLFYQSYIRPCWLWHCRAWYGSTLSTSTVFGYVKFVLEFRVFLPCASRDYNLLYNNGYKYDWFLTFRGPWIVIYYYNKTKEMHSFLTFIFGIDLHMFRTGVLSIIMSLVLYTQQ